MRGTPGKRSCSTESWQVLRPEIVPPLRHAVRLVDREEREPRARQQIQAARHQQALGRDIEQVEPAVERARARRARAAPASSVELRKAARTPAWRSASTWSCMSAMSGEITTPVPARASAGIVEQDATEPSNNKKKTRSKKTIAGDGRRHPRRQPRPLLRAPRVARQRAARARPRDPRRGARLRRQRHQRVRRRPLARHPRPPLGHARPRPASSRSSSTRSRTRPSISATSSRSAKAASTCRPTSSSSSALVLGRRTARRRERQARTARHRPRQAHRRNSRSPGSRCCAASAPDEEDVVWIEKVGAIASHPRRAGFGRRPRSAPCLLDTKPVIAVSATLGGEPPFPGFAFAMGLDPAAAPGTWGEKNDDGERESQTGAATCRCRRRRRSTGGNRVSSTSARTCPIPAAPTTRGSSRPATGCAGS